MIGLTVIHNSNFIINTRIFNLFYSFSYYVPDLHRLGHYEMTRGVSLSVCLSVCLSRAST